MAGQIEVNTEDIDYGKTILAAIIDSLESEERRLKPRSVQRRWPWTVRGGYNEDWIRYLLVKELADRFPELEFDLEAETGGEPRLDLLICNHATLELKGPHLISDNFDKSIYRNIQIDFQKQRRRATQEPDLQHFVLLIVRAPASKSNSIQPIQQWLSKLESDVRLAGISVNLKKSEPLALNGNNWLMQCCLYDVR